MRVLFLSRYQFPLVKSGGTGVVVYELMKELQKLGIDLEHWTWPVVHAEKSIPKEEIKNMIEFQPLCKCNIENIQLEKLFDVTLTNLSMIKSFESLKTFDLIHVHTWELFLVGIVAKYLWDIPLVFTTHDIMLGDRPGEVHSTDIYKYSVQAERILGDESDYIFCVSDENRSLFEKLYPNTVGKCKVIPNGVNLQSFKKLNSGRIFEKHNIEVEKPYVLFLGRASRQKGLHLLLKAIRYLPESIPIVFATSIKRWDGEVYQPAQTYLDDIKELQAQRGKIHLILNEWDRELLSELYSFAAFTVMPSIYEPCGMVALESQACETPVLSNNIGYMKKCITNKTGVLIEFIDSDQSYPRRLAKNMIDLWNKNEVLVEMGKAARDNVEKFHSWHNRAVKHIQLYKKLIEKHRRAN